MSLTRRDLLAAGLALPIAAALPATVQPHLSGQANTQEEVFYHGLFSLRDMLVPGLVCCPVEIYLDEQKAILRVAITEEGDIVAWHERIFVGPEEIAMMRTMCAMLKEGSL